MPNDLVEYAVINQDGTIERTGACGTESLYLQARADQGLVVNPGEVTDATHYLTADGFAKIPAGPGPWARWNGDEWVEQISPEVALAAHWSALRAERNRLLTASDWTQLPDIPERPRLAWQDYRQALRDMPEKTADPARPVWPTPPKS